MLLIISIILGIPLGVGVALYICGIMLENTSMGNFSGTDTTLSSKGVIITYSEDSVGKNTTINYTYPGCPFNINKERNRK